MEQLSENEYDELMDFTKAQSVLTETNSPRVWKAYVEGITDMLYVLGIEYYDIEKDLLGGDFK